MYYGILNKLIKQELDRGRRIAIYPYGRIGMQAKDILVNRYGQKAILIDNGLGKYNSEIVSFEEFMESDSENISIILCTDSRELNMELCQQIAKKRLKSSVINILNPGSDTGANREDIKDSLSKKKYCVLQRKADECGLFSYFIILLGGLDYCKKNNLIPVIDMLSYGNMYQDGQKINSWELFFEQPAGVGLEKAHIAEYVDCNKLRTRPVMSMDFLTNNKKIEYWRRLCREYIKLNHDMEQYIAQCMKEFMPNGREMETVGVLCRGSDYTRLRPYGHPIQPDSKMVIDKIKQFLKRKNCSYIFLATEDNAIYEELYKEFGEHLIAPNVSRYSDTGNQYLADIVRKERKGYENGKEYLASIYMLTKCKYLVAGRTSGSVAALLLSEGFEETYLWNLGYYGID